MPQTKITKSELIAQIAKESDESAGTIERVLDSLVATLTEQLAAGNAVTLPGLGVFETRARSAREGRNPRTGETLQIAATSIPAFRAGTALKRAVAPN